MEDWNDLAYFAAVADHGGFAPAGRALGVPKSKLSRRVSGLEARLGLRLIQRSTRRFAVTPVGEAVLRHARAMRAQAEGVRALAEEAGAYPQVVEACYRANGLPRRSTTAGTKRSKAGSQTPKKRQSNLPEEFGFSCVFKVRALCL